MTVEHPQIDKCIVKQSFLLHESVSHRHTDIEGDRQSQRGGGGERERERERGRQAGRQADRESEGWKGGMKKEGY